MASLLFGSCYQLFALRGIAQRQVELPLLLPFDRRLHKHASCRTSSDSGTAVLLHELTGTPFLCAEHTARDFQNHTLLPPGECAIDCEEEIPRF